VPETFDRRLRCLRFASSRDTQFCIERAAENLAYYQSVIDRTVRPSEEASQARSGLRDALATLAEAIAHYAALTAAREAGLRAEYAEIEQA
jgi:hypothetical protein